MHLTRFRRNAACSFTALSLLSLLLAGTGCAASGTTASNGAASGTHITVGLTYVPNIQFAPFYVAEKLGYYKQAGLDITLRHQTNATEGEFDAIAAGQEDGIFAGGDEMLGAVTHGVPLLYVAQVYQKYPITLIVPANSPIHSPADLRGHSIGIPGKYGESYYGLLALLQAGHLSPSDVNIQSIGYTQVPQLLAHKVDAVIGYINNEPIQLQKAGMRVRTLAVTTTQPLISDGLIVTQRFAQQHPQATKALVAATLKGVQYTIAHPQDAVNISKQYVPGLDNPTNAQDALAVLDATIPLWQSSGKLGYTNPAQWQSMLQFLQQAGQLSGSVDISKVVSDSYLP